MLFCGSRSYPFGCCMTATMASLACCSAMLLLLQLPQLTSRSSCQQPFSSCYRTWFQGLKLSVPGLLHPDTPHHPPPSPMALPPFPCMEATMDSTGMLLPAEYCYYHNHTATTKSLSNLAVMSSFRVPFQDCLPLAPNPAPDTVAKLVKPPQPAQPGTLPQAPTAPPWVAGQSPAPLLQACPKAVSFF